MGRGCPDPRLSGLFASGLCVHASVDTARHPPGAPACHQQPLGLAGPFPAPPWVSSSVCWGKTGPRRNRVKGPGRRGRERPLGPARHQLRGHNWPHIRAPWNVLKLQTPSLRFSGCQSGFQQLPVTLALAQLAWLMWTHNVDSPDLGLSAREADVCCQQQLRAAPRSAPRHPPRADGQQDGPLGCVVL